MTDIREKLIMKSAKECTLCNEALESAFDEAGGMSASEFAKELSQAITIQAGVELFSPGAIKMRLSRMDKCNAVLQTASLDSFKKENKGAKATAVVNELTKQYQNPKMLAEVKDEIQEKAESASIDTTTRMLVDTEINDRVNRAFKMLDDVIGAWEASDGLFWLDTDFIKLNLERIKRKVEAHENTD
jgi:hypothetical protein